MTGDGAWVKNLKVENINVKGGNYTGGIIGFADFGSYVEGITFSGKNTVERRFLIGEIARVSNADIVDCEAVADFRSQMPIWIYPDGRVCQAIFINNDQIIKKEYYRAEKEI